MPFDKASILHYHVPRIGLNNRRPFFAYTCILTSIHMLPKQSGKINKQTIWNITWHNLTNLIPTFAAYTLYGNLVLNTVMYHHYQNLISYVKITILSKYWLSLPCYAKARLYFPSYKIEIIQYVHQISLSLYFLIIERLEIVYNYQPFANFLLCEFIAHKK